MTSFGKKALIQKNSSFPRQILRSKNSYHHHHDHLKGLKLVMMMVRCYLPEDAVMEILARVPAHLLLKLRGVCRKWKDLISSQHFKDKHTDLMMRSKEQEHDYDASSSMFLFRLNGPFKDNDRMISSNHQLMIIDKWEQPGRTEPIFLEGIAESEEDKLRYNSRMCSLCSFSGLIVMDHVMDQMRILLRDQLWMDQVADQVKLDFCFIIGNPITGENVKIDVSKTRYRIWALFFNPRIKEYCVILNKFGRYIRDYDEFEILNLGSQPCCKPLKRPESLPYKYEYVVDGHPLVVDDDNIYWQLKNMSCEQLILAFNIRAEEFSFLPHPNPNSLHGCHEARVHGNMHIINIHGRRLSFVQIETIHSVRMFNIWTLNMIGETQDPRPNWIKTHNIGIPICEFSNFDRGRNPNSTIKVLTVGEEEMLFHDTDKQIIFAYNFKLLTLRLVWKDDEKQLSLEDYSFLPYVPSFASLKNCPSIISLGHR